MGICCTVTGVSPPLEKGTRLEGRPACRSGRSARKSANCERGACTQPSSVQVVASPSGGTLKVIGGSSPAAGPVAAASGGGGAGGPLVALAVAASTAAGPSKSLVRVTSGAATRPATSGPVTLVTKSLFLGGPQCTPRRPGLPQILTPHGVSAPGECLPPAEGPGMMGTPRPACCC